MDKIERNINVLKMLLNECEKVKGTCEKCKESATCYALLGHVEPKEAVSRIKEIFKV